MVLAIDVHVEMLVHLASLIERQIGHGERVERVSDGRGLDVEARLARRLRREDAGDHYPDHAVTSTDRIGGRCRAASTPLSPSVRAKNEPLWVPKYTDSGSWAGASRRTAARA